MVSYEYFMDELKDYELDILIDNVHYPHKTDWEIMRYLLWGVLAPYAKGHKTPEQMFPLPTDNDTKETEISNDDINKLEEKAKQMEKLLQNTK